MLGMAQEMEQEKSTQIQNRLKRYIQILSNIEDAQDKFLWIMDFGKNSRPMSDSLKIKFILVLIQLHLYLKAWFASLRMCIVDLRPRTLESSIKKSLRK